MMPCWIGGFYAGATTVAAIAMLIFCIYLSIRWSKG